MIDQQTRAAFDEAVRMSQRKGTSLIEELHQRNLLSTDKAERDLLHAEVMKIVYGLESRGAAEMMKVAYGRSHGTPEEMFRAIMDFCRSWGQARR